MRCLPVDRSLPLSGDLCLARSGVACRARSGVFSRLPDVEGVDLPGPPPQALSGVLSLRRLGLPDASLNLSGVEYPKLQRGGEGRH